MEYSYDTLNRLTEEHALGDSGSTVFRRTYGFDLVGNRTRRVSEDLVSDVLTSVTETLMYNGLGQLATMEWSEDTVDYDNLYGYDLNGNLISRTENENGSQAREWVYTWDYADRMTSAIRKNSEEIPQVTIEYTYCGSCGGALRTRKKTDESGTVTSWLRFEYEGINLLRIDERYDDDTPADGIDSEDPWRAINTYVHAPGQIGNVVRAYWYRYSWDNGPTPCASGSWVPCYDALGNQIGVVESTNGKFYRWEIDAYGNSLEDTDVSTNEFLPLDSEAPKCHLTGKFVDPDTGYAYFYARWLDTTVGMFLGRDPAPGENGGYRFAAENPTLFYDPDGSKYVVNKSNKPIYVVYSCPPKSATKRIMKIEPGVAVTDNAGDKNRLKRQGVVFQLGNEQTEADIEGFYPNERDATCEKYVFKCGNCSRKYSGPDKKVSGPFIGICSKNPGSRIHKAGWKWYDWPKHPEVVWPKPPGYPSPPVSWQVYR